VARDRSNFSKDAGWAKAVGVRLALRLTATSPNLPVPPSNGNAAFPDVKPIIMAAVAIFRKYQQVAADLQQARTSLLERETIDRAKTQLIKQRNFDEPQAYRWLRRKAMNESKRIAAVAAELLGSAHPEGPKE